MVDIPRAIGYLLASQFQDGQTAGSITPNRVRDLIVTMRSRTPRFRSTDPEYGAIGDGSSHPLSGIAAFSTATSPAGLAAITISGATPYSWATNAAYGLTFTTTTSASTASGTSLPLTSVAGDVTNPMKFVVVGMSVTGTNIPGGVTVTARSFTSGTPNKVNGPLAGTITLSSAISGTVANGATLTFSYTSTMMQALQMDWLGIQAAEYATGNTSGWGGQHMTPGGQYQINRPILRSQGTFLANQTTWVGDGQFGQTRLYFTTDFGPGTWAVVTPNRSSAGNSVSCLTRDMALVGPGAGSTMGASSCGMHGMSIGTVDVCENIYSGGFYSAFNLLGDHQILDKCTGTGGYFGVYFAPLTTNATYGDASFRDCDFTGNLKASVGCSGTNAISYAKWDRVHCGFSPVGFYKETGSVTNFIIDGTSIQLSMEAIGNCTYYDENSSGLISGHHWYNFNTLLDPTGTQYYDSSIPLTAIWQVGSMNNCEFRGGADPYTTNYNRSTHPITQCIIQCAGTFGQNKMYNCGTLVGIGSTTFPCIRTGSALTGDSTWDSGNASGTWRTTNGAIAVNTFVSLSQFGVVIAPSTNTGIVGLAYYGASGSIGAAGIAIQDHGYNNNVVKQNTTDTWSEGTWLQMATSSNGKVIAFNNAARTCCVGKSWYPATNPSTTCYMEIDIKGP